MQRFSRVRMRAGGTALLVLLYWLGACVAPIPTSRPQNAPERPAQATSAAPSHPASPPPLAADDFFGVSSSGEIVYNPQARALARDAGVQLVRTSVDWASVEPVRGTFHWDSLDKMFRTLADSNLTPLVLILSNPAWAASSSCGPVSDLAAFDQFLRALFARYPQVKYWALYNEPDNAGDPRRNPSGCFGGADLDANGRPDVGDYAEQLRTAWRALHAINPGARLVTGALAFDNFDRATAPHDYPGGGEGGTFNFQFPAQLFQYMAAHPLPAGEKYFDLLAFNFYGIYGPYWELKAGGHGVVAKANMLNRLLRDAGLDAPLVVGETGEDSFSLGAQMQSESVAKTLTRARAAAIQSVFWWTFQDHADSEPPPANRWKYGLIDQNFSPKASFKAYQTAARELGGARFLERLAVNGGEGYIFDERGSGLAVFWSSSDIPVTVVFAGNRVQLTSVYGLSQELVDGGAGDSENAVGRIGVRTNAAPVYVRVLEP